MKYMLLIIFSGAGVSAFAMSAKQVASRFDATKQVDLSGDKVRFRFLIGINARIIASSYEQVIGLDGSIRCPLSNVTSQVTVELSDDTAVSQQVTVPLTRLSSKRYLSGGFFGFFGFESCF